MITTLDSGRYFHVSGETSDEIQKDLDKAVQLAEQYAQRGGWQGVLVSRHESNLFTVAICDEVPYGLTRERDG